jgi:hypothetical protein
LKQNVLRALALILIVVVAMGVAGVAAYHFGATSGPNPPMMRGFGERGGGVMWASNGGGVGLAGLLGLLGMGALVVGGILFVLLLAAVLSPDRGRFGSGAPVAPLADPAAGDVERLRELSDLHTAGRLTDEEFTAAKRKLLGM